MTKSLGFILVKTQLPENIGFSARALKNFINFTNLIPPQLNFFPDQLITTHMNQ